MVTPNIGERQEAVRWMARFGSRRRAWQAAISPGEAHASVDPGVPEWDFLSSAHSRMRGGTPGIETS